MQQFERLIASKQNESMRSLPDDFTTALRHFCQQYEPRLPLHGNITYLEDEKAQADIFLAARVARGDTDAIMANDMDFHACLGDISLSIHSFKYEQKNKAIKKKYCAGGGIRRRNKQMAQSFGLGGSI
mmetsp:Transcript_24382/g.36172  ORF Transcript_24382/g.36172 Transcript_24382/m.36172 type:complete len:128 (-) Transcript_24382:389-772(-)